MSNIVYLNGSFLSKNKALTSCVEPGFSYGYGLFETMRSYTGKIFYLDAHINRLRKSCRILNLSVPGNNFLENCIKKTLKINKISNAYIRLNVWQGKKRTNILVFVKKFDIYRPFMYKIGAKAVVSDFSINEYSPLRGHKTMNYLNFLQAKLQAQKKGADEAILLNTKGDLAEGSRSNIFLVKRGILCTPSLDSGCIPGIARMIVLKIAKKNYIRAVEKGLKIKDLLTADEAFLTNSLMEIMPLIRVNKNRIADGKPGKITKMLLAGYRELYLKR